LSCLLLPNEAHVAGFALRAFNVEIAQIKDTVSDMKLGEVRIQFWKDTIEDIFKGKVPSQPVAAALASVLRRRKLSKMWFTRLLEARSKELKVQSYMRTQDLEDYVENTNSSLLYLTLEVLGIHDVNTDHAASHLGKAEGIVTMLRASPYHRASRRASLPMDVLMRHGASQEEFFRGDLTQNLKDAVFDFASLAHTHLLKMRNLKESVPKSASRVFLPAVSCSTFLERLRRSDFNPFDPVLSRRPHFLSLSLLKAAWTNRF
jgi:NADH dehydrogenase [ubiquinone] 1 alpha subcomplex assembly factor 6